MLPPMQALRAIGITLLLLVGVWASLAVIGAIAGVLKPVRLGGGADPSLRDAGVQDAGAVDAGPIDAGPSDAGPIDAGPIDAGPDAGVEDAGPVDAGPIDAGPVDAGPRPDTGAPEPYTGPAGPTHRVRVCDAGYGAREPENDAVRITHALDRAFALGDLVGDATPEIVVGCANRFVVVGLVPGPAGLAPVRVAVLTLESRRDVPLHTSGPAVGDVSGDGLPDAVLPFYFRAASGGSRGGCLFLWRRTQTGLARPLPVAQSTFQTVALVDLDGRGGLDVLAVDRGRPWAEQPGRVQVFQGATRPRRRATLDAGKWAREVTLADLDLDGVRDVVVGSDEALHLHRRREGFRFDPAVAIDAAHHWGLTSGDVDGDGHPDVLVGGSGGLAVLHARERESLEGASLRLVAASHHAAIPAQVADVDGDGRAEVFAYGQQLVLFERVGATSWRERPLTEREGVDGGVQGLAWVRIQDAAALLWAELEDGALDLFVAERPRLDALARPDEASPLADAPFVVRTTVR